MRMTQTSVCTAHFVESHIASGALSKKHLHRDHGKAKEAVNQSCRYMYQ